MTKPLPPEKKRAAKDHPWRKQFERKPKDYDHDRFRDRVVPFNARMGVNK